MVGKRREAGSHLRADLNYRTVGGNPEVAGIAHVGISTWQVGLWNGIGISQESHLPRRDSPPRPEFIPRKLWDRVQEKLRSIDAVVCGGWVSFLKELACDSHTSHSMSFDIDVILRAQACEREAVDRIKALLSKSFAYQPDKHISRKQKR